MAAHICGGNLRLRIVLLPTNLSPVHTPKRCKIDMFQISCFVRQLDNHGQKCDEVVDAECIVSHMIYSSYKFAALFMIRVEIMQNC